MGDEAAAAEPARGHLGDEHPIKLHIPAMAVFAQVLLRLVGKPLIHGKACLEDRRPGGGKVVVLHAGKACLAEARDIGLRRQERAAGNAFVQRGARRRRKRRPRHQVGEAKPPTRAQHTEALAEQRPLVRNVQEGFLRQGDVEALIGQGQARRVAADEAHTILQADTAGKPVGAHDTALGKIDAGHVGAQSMCNQPRRATHAGADVQNAAAGGDAGALGQRDRRIDAAIVVLVVRVEILGPQPLRIVPGAAERPQDLRLADRMRVVKGGDLHAVRLLPARSLPEAARSA